MNTTTALPNPSALPERDRLPWPGLLALAMAAFITVLTEALPAGLLPQIGTFDERGDSSEECKLAQETHKILADERIAITATTVRVPVFRSHSEAVNIETQEKLTAEQARELLARAPGISVLDEPDRALYPLPLEARGRDEVFVGRIREDRSIKNGLNLWVVSDNLRKGAALNTVQIGELLIERGWM